MSGSSSSSDLNKSLVIPIKADPLQFVKIPEPDLSKKAVEQIRLAEEVKITKEKIKEVEEEWQNNLLNWKSKRRLSNDTKTGKGGKDSIESGSGGENGENGADSDSNGGGRKIKTFSEILNEKAKSGYRLGYNLQRYVELDDEDQDMISTSQKMNHNNNHHHNNNNNSEDSDDIIIMSSGGGKNDHHPSERNRKSSGGGDDSNSGSSDDVFFGKSRNDDLVVESISQALNGSERRRNGGLNDDLLINDEGVGHDDDHHEHKKHHRQSGSSCNTSSAHDKEFINIQSSPHDKEMMIGTNGTNPNKNFNGDIQELSSSSGYKPKNQSNGGVKSCRQQKDSNGSSGADVNNRSVVQQKSMSENQKNVWNYLLQHQDVNADSRIRVHKEDHLTDDDEDDEYEDDDECLNGESTKIHDDAEQQQLINFKAKLSAFENLSKAEQNSQLQSSSAPNNNHIPEDHSPDVHNQHPKSASTRVKQHPASSTGVKTSSIHAVKKVKGGAASSSSSTTKVKGVRNSSQQELSSRIFMKSTGGHSMGSSLEPGVQGQSHEQQQHPPSHHTPSNPHQLPPLNNDSQMVPRPPVRSSSSSDMHLTQYNNTKSSHLNKSISGGHLNQILNVNHRPSSSQNNVIHNHNGNHHVMNPHPKMMLNNQQMISHSAQGSQVSSEFSDYELQVDQMTSRMARSLSASGFNGSNQNQHQQKHELHHNHQMMQQQVPTPVNPSLHVYNNSGNNLSQQQMIITSPYNNQSGGNQYNNQQQQQQHTTQHHHPDLNNPAIIIQGNKNGNNNSQGSQHHLAQVNNHQQSMIYDPQNQLYANQNYLESSSTGDVMSHNPGSNSVGVTSNNCPFVDQPQSNCQHYYVLNDVGTGQAVVIQEPLYSNHHVSSSSSAAHHPNHHQYVHQSSGNQQQPFIQRQHHPIHPHGLPSHPVTSSSSTPQQSSQAPHPNIQSGQSYPVYHPKPYHNNQQHPRNAQQQIVTPATGATPPEKPKHALPPTTSSSVISSASIPSQQSSKSTPGYNRNHWLVQEADLRMQIQQASASSASTSAPVVNPQKKCPSQVASSGNHENHDAIYENFNQATPPVSQKTAPPNVLSVSGRKKCSSCGDELGRGCAAMVIESLSLYYHINCFRCSVCHIQLGNGTCGTDVRVRNHKLHCNNCYSNDEAGLKFSRV